MQEIWVEIDGCEGSYQVSNMGNVRSLPRIVQYPKHTQTLKGRYLKPQDNSKGYYRVNVKSQKFVHRLVAEAFIPNPNNLPQVNHKDGNKHNNRADNLEWTNNSENQMHGRDLGLITNPKGEDVPSHKLTDDNVRWILTNYRKGDGELGRHALAKKFNVSHQTIKNIVDRKKWKHIQL